MSDAYKHETQILNVHTKLNKCLKRLKCICIEMCVLGNISLSLADTPEALSK